MALATQATAESLLGVRDGHLAFQVLGSEHDGRRIELRSPKITVGSGQQCTLRLNAIEVRPMHCLILRGQDGVAIRSLCEGTLLNYSEFDLARLRIGDILTVGSVSLELSEIQVGQDEPRPATSDVATSDDLDPLRVGEQIEALAKQLSEQETSGEPKRQRLGEAEPVPQSASKTVDELHQRLETAEADRSDLRRQRDELREEKTRLQSDVGDRDEQLDQTRRELQTHLEEQTASAVANRDRLTAAQSVAQSLDEVVAELQQQVNKSQGERRQWEQDRERLNSERDALKSERESLTVQLQEAHGQFQHQCDERAASHREKIAAAQEVAQSLDAAVTQLQKEVVDSNRDRSEATRQLDQLNSERTALQQQLARQAEQLEAADAEFSKQFETQLAEAANQYSVLEQEAGEIRSELARAREELTDSAKEKSALRQELEERRQAAQDEAENADDVERLQARITELQSECEDRNAQVQQLQEQLAQAEESIASSDEQQRESEARIEQKVERLEVQARELAEQRERFKRERANTNGAAAATADEEPVESKTMAWSPSATQPGSEEDQIEQYMTQLLQRSGGQAEEPTPYVATAWLDEEDEEGEEGEEGEESVMEIRSVVAPQGKDAEDFDFIPLTQPPEGGSDMQAMRAVANHESRMAIHASSKRRWLIVVVTKSLLGLACFGLGGLLLVLSRSLSPKIFPAAMVLFAIGSYFVVQALARIRSYGRRRVDQMESSSDDKATEGEQAATPAEQASPEQASPEQAAAEQAAAEQAAAEQAAAEAVPQACEADENA